jgi:plastocyanin
MKSLALWILGGMLVSFPSALLAADAKGVGIVKGTVTVGGKPATDAVVSIEGLSKQQIKTQMLLHKPRKTIIDQRNLKFTPTVVAIMAGETVDFPNNDKSWHNVYSKGGANDFDLGLYPPGKSRNKKFEKPGVSRVLCNAHPGMEAFIVVKDHPFYSATDSRGNYEINNVPLGKVRVQIWHPNLDVRNETVELVRDGEVFALNVDLKSLR